MSVPSKIAGSHPYQQTTSLALSRMLARCYSMVYKTINSDQLYETRSLILEIPKVLTVEGPLVSKLGLVRI
jgi:hypothetical protein